MTDLTRALVATLCLTIPAAPAAFGAMLDPFAQARLSEPADLNRDGLINSADLALLLGDYGRYMMGGSDLNLDGVVDAGDMALLFGSWVSLPTINAPNVSGDALGHRVYVASVVNVERSPFRSDWTRIWALDLESGSLLGFDVDVYLDAVVGVLLHRQWIGPHGAY